MSFTTRKPFALFILIISAIIGATAFIFFLFFLYAGPLNPPVLDMNELERLVINAMISVAFFLQHSIMIRRPFRRWLGVFISPHYQGAVYTVASGAVLFACIVFWQRSDVSLYDLQGLPSHVIRAVYFLSILGLGWGMWALRSIDMFGLGPVLEKIQADPSPSMALTIRGPYRWVRHPLYLFMIVLFWACPSLTADRLLLNILWTIWIVIGTILEERDLVDDFGDAYRDYQASVPMLVPHGLMPAYPTDKGS